MAYPERKEIYPVQIQGDNTDANDSFASCMVHVFSIKDEINAFDALCRAYTHVIAWNASGDVIRTYDNR
jgi:hypothetical protein